MDVFFLMKDIFVHGETTAEIRELFDHGASSSRLGASVFWMSLSGASFTGGEQKALEDWQITRDFTERGIIEIIEEHNP